MNNSGILFENDFKIHPRSLYHNRQFFIIRCQLLRTKIDVVLSEKSASKDLRTKLTANVP